MRIVAVADTHLYHRELTVPDGDVFVHAGDLCRGGEIEELREAVDWIAELPHRHKVIVAGNHDWAFANDAEKARELVARFTYLQDSAASIDGFSFWGSPWQAAYNDWAFNLPRGKALADKWSLIPESLDVLITHGPPAGIGDVGPVAGRLGCDDLLARVKHTKPRVHLFGHIHTDGGAWQIGTTLFANVTTWECERQPTVIDIDEKNARTVIVPPARRS